MPFDPSKPDFNSAQLKPDYVSEPQPGDEDVVRALVEIEHATQHSAPSGAFRNQSQNPASAPVLPEPSGIARLMGNPRAKILFVYGMVITMVLGARVGYLRNGTSNRAAGSRRSARTVDRAAQNEIEGLLARVAAGDREAASDVIERAPSWLGKTQRTQSTSRSLDVAFNLPDLHQREAAIEANLALDGVPKSQPEIATLESQLSSPAGRPWALWMLGALGNRGVDPVHTAKIIDAYVDHPDANTRAAAVNALAVLGTDETIPMLLDRFRNDPSPLVQERAACSLAESGMYTHEQRVVAAATLVSWLDDSLLSAQQHAWTIQALGDIAHQNLGNDSAAWRSWLESVRGSG